MLLTFFFPCCFPGAWPSLSLSNWPLPLPLPLPRPRNALLSGLSMAITLFIEWRDESHDSFELDSLKMYKSRYTLLKMLIGSKEVFSLTKHILHFYHSLPLKQLKNFQHFALLAFPKPRRIFYGNF